MEVRLYVKKGRSNSDALWIRRFPTVIGRHRDCNLRIAARQVSRRHCALKNRDGWLVVCDLGSCNGTLINGRLVRGETFLRRGDILEVGPVLFEIDYTPPASHPPNLGDPAETLRNLGDTAIRAAAELLPSDSNALSIDQDMLSAGLTEPSSLMGQSGATAGDSSTKIIILDEDASLSPITQILSHDAAGTERASRKSP